MRGAQEVLFYIVLSITITTAAPAHLTDSNRVTIVTPKDLADLTAHKQTGAVAKKSDAGPKKPEETLYVRCG